MRCCVWLMEATSPASTSDPNHSATSSAGAASGDFSIVGFPLQPWAGLALGSQAKMVGLQAHEILSPLGLGC
jgi:hypothetical protein